MASIDQPGAAGLDFDPAELRARYRYERDRRLRPEGTAQYVEPTADFGYFVEDPYTEREATRPALRDEVDAVVIGGGFGGLLAGARLRQAGIERIRIIEKGGDVGGTWYWNRYPGIRCDIESYVYLPLLEEVGSIPSEKYTRGEEIRDHAVAIARHFDLYRDACFQTEATGLRWEESTRRWTVRTDRDDVITARYVICTAGPFGRPKLPGLPGMDTFAGHTFHTSRWDYEYTGGDATGNLHRLADKRVALVGTGATAIQCVPILAEHAERLYVVQRTPSTVDTRDNRPTDPVWAAGLTPGWHQRRRENFLNLISGVPQDENLVGDQWTSLVAMTAAEFAGTDPAALAAAEIDRRGELADFKKMNELRARVDAIVDDKATAEALKPWYRHGCKRPTFSDEYLPAFNRPNVTLLDTDGLGIERITEHGLVCRGVEFEVDCIIFATGYETGGPLSALAGPAIAGRDGQTLAEHWKAGLRTLHGMSSHGFPNLFRMGLGQNGVAVNFVHVLDEQAGHIAAMIGEAETARARYVEPSAQAEALWVAEIEGSAHPAAALAAECTPGYYNNEGKPRGGPNVRYVGTAVEFHELLQRWRTESGMADVLVDLPVGKEIQ